MAVALQMYLHKFSIQNKCVVVFRPGHANQNNNTGLHTLPKGLFA